MVEQGPFDTSAGVAARSSISINYHVTPHKHRLGIIDRKREAFFNLRTSIMSMHQNGSNDRSVARMTTLLMTVRNFQQTLAMT
jgi:hypothetical protein